MKSLVNNLSLVYPPFSNQEGDWFYEDKEVQEYVKNSKLYMIVHRHELFFKDCCFIAEGFGFFEFKFIMDGVESEIFRIPANEVMEEVSKDSGTVIVELGDDESKLCKLIRVTNEATKDVLSWYTVDKMIYDIFHENIEICKGNIESLRKYWNFDLLYVGISKKHDSFTRLFGNAHHKRLKILTNERQKSDTSRLTDEVMILLYEIDSVIMRVYDESMEIEDFLSNELVDKVKVVADAEKAFVFFLEAKYNEVLYANYPNGEDGLANDNYDRYTFEIDEELTILTEKGNFEGHRGHLNLKDFIFVNKEEATLVKVGDLYQNEL